MDPRSPVVVAARRTPFAEAGRALADRDAASLAAPVLQALAAALPDRPEGPCRPAGPGRPDEVLLGNCCGPGGDVARVAVLAAGLGVALPAVTVDRQCGSGLEAVRLAAALVASGAADSVLAGGVESASTAPRRLMLATRSQREAGDDQPRPYTRAPFAPPGFDDPEMGAAADSLARLRAISRARQDEYAARSHRLAVAAQAAGAFDAELVALGGAQRDERPRPGLTAGTLSRFRPAFGPDGTATAGNSCGISDGAAAVTIVPERWRDDAGLPGLRIVAGAVSGVDPALPGLGAAPAVREVLARAGRTLAEVAVLELTEAFASQVLACTDELGLDPFGADADRVCPQGGAIALGHPWGASGTFLLVRLFARLVAADDVAPGTLGVAACAIGGGQGVAVLVERVG